MPSEQFHGWLPYLGAELLPDRSDVFAVFDVVKLDRGAVPAGEKNRVTDGTLVDDITGELSAVLRRPKLHRLFGRNKFFHGCQEAAVSPIKFEAIPRAIVAPPRATPADLRNSRRLKP